MASITSRQPPIPSEPVIIRLWRRMGEIYGTRWSSAYGDDPLSPDGAGDTWAKGLAGLSAQQIGAGISSAMASADPWPPSLPEFRAMCLGIPSFATVSWQMTQPIERQSRFVRLIWQHLDAWAYSRASIRDAQTLLKGAYEVARDYVMRGGAIPEPSAPIAHEKRTPVPASDEIVDKAMKDIANVLKTELNPPGDHKERTE